MSSPSSEPMFFTLPRELRDKVYHHLLSGLAYNIRTSSHIATIEYGYILPDRSFHRMCDGSSIKKPMYISCPSPRWLLSCTQMLSEGLAQFSRGSKCTEVTHYSEYRGEPDWKTKLVRDALLLPRVREMYLAVAPVTHSEPYPQESKITCRFQTQSPHLDHGAANPALGYRNVLPEIKRISVEVQIRFLTMADGKEFCLPAYERLYKQIYFFPGSTYEEAHIHIQIPELPGSFQGGGRERVQHLPAFARTLPRLQASLVELGKSLTAAANEGNQMPDGKHWVVRDWIDQSTHAWHLKIKPKPSGPSSPDTFEHGGLQRFTAPELKRTPEILGRYQKEVMFVRDSIPKAGHSSWSCDHSGETVWLEDGPVGSQSGYMRADAAAMEAKYDAVFEELRSQQTQIAPVAEGMGVVKPRARTSRNYGPHFISCSLGTFHRSPS